jgi:hypothetical protein
LDFRLHVTHVSPKGEEAEERAQDIFAFGDPSNGFDVERVPGEEGGDEGTAPKGAGHAAQKVEEQEGVEDVKEQAGGMVAAGIERK